MSLRRKKSRTRGRLRLLTLALLAYWCLLFISTHVPLPAVNVIGQNDKVVHFVAYASLAWITAMVLSQKTALNWSGYLKIWWGLAAYGIVDELLQMIPVLHRSADVNDWIADVLGVATALCAYWLCTTLIRRSYSKSATDVAATANRKASGTIPHSRSESE